MYTLRQLSAADRADFRQLRQTALTVSPDDFMIAAGEEASIPRRSIEAALEEPRGCNFFLGAFTKDTANLVGIARMPLDRLLIEAAEAGLRSVRLEVVAENRSAITLYEALGFVPYGRQPAAYRRDEREWGLPLMTRDCTI